MELNAWHCRQGFLPSLSTALARRVRAQNIVQSLGAAAIARTKNRPTIEWAAGEAGRRDALALPGQPPAPTAAYYALLSLVIGAPAGALLHVHAPVYAPLLPFVITVGGGGLRLGSSAIASDPEGAIGCSGRFRT